MEYLGILLVILFSTIYIEYRYKIGGIYNNWRERLKITLFFFVIGVVWDSFAVWREHWYFNYQNLLGAKIGFLPLEEYLFILIVPYSIVTIWFYFKLKSEPDD